MSDYAVMLKTERYVELCFYVEKPEILALGERMNAVCEDAYMNGYNWEAFFNCYLAQQAPALLEGMKTDPEAGMYVAYYPLTPENEQKVERFVQLVHTLVENEAELLRFLQEKGGEIAWD